MSRDPIGEKRARPLSLDLAGTTEEQAVYSFVDNDTLARYDILGLTPSDRCCPYDDCEVGDERAIVSSIDHTGGKYTGKAHPRIVTRSKPREMSYFWCFCERERFEVTVTLKHQICVPSLCAACDPCASGEEMHETTSWETVRHELIQLQDVKRGYSLEFMRKCEGISRLDWTGCFPVGLMTCPVKNGKCAKKLGAWYDECEKRCRGLARN